MTKRHSMLAAAAFATLLLGTVGAHAQNGSSDTMTKDAMPKDTMGTDTMGKDTMGKDAMSHDAMMADDMGINAVDGVALKGFDPVAYFLQNKPVKGSPENVVAYHGVTYEFATKAHAALFAREPAKYVPTFNGFCATAVAEGVKADVDPHDYVIHAGKLNVFYSDDARAVFLKDQTGTEKKAENNWPQVMQQTKIIR
jgi:pentapeptide MXKDX repeat protein